MNNKGLTLIELISVLIIVTVVSAMLFPNIVAYLDKNRQSSAEDIEKLLISNLELYNTDNGNQLWQNDRSCIVVSIDDLLQLNPNIDLGECLLTNEKGLVIKNENQSFNYYADITCGRNLESLGTNKYVLAFADKVYYKSTNIYRCE